MLADVTRYFESLSPEWLYCALFASAYLENIFPPIPGDTVLVFAAYLVGRSQRHFMGVFISTTLGSVAGFMTYYLAGRMVGLEYFLNKNFRFLPAARFEKADAWVQRFGNWVILANRFLAGVRTVISLVAGIYRLPWITTLALALISCAVWNGVLIWIGYLLGSNWEFIENILRQYNRIILGLIILTGGIWYVRRKLTGHSTR